MLNEGDSFGEMYLLTIILEWFACRTQGLRITIVDITTQNAEVTDVTLQVEQLGKLWRYNHVATKRLCEFVG